MSCFVFEEKSDSAQRLADELAGPLRSLQDAARKIATISQECKLPMEVEDYVEKFKPHMMDIVWAWCKGAKFADICKMTNIFEGIPSPPKPPTLDAHAPPHTTRHDATHAVANAVVGSQEASSVR
jgi:hypothetical protein